MSLLELLFRFGVVAAIFTGAMFLLRRYGRTRVRQAEENHGLLVTSRLTVSRGVQLLVVKAGRKTFLVSSGGRVSMTPVDLTPASVTSDPVREPAREEAPRAGATSLPSAPDTPLEAPGFADATQEEMPLDARTPWTQRIGASIGIAIRQRLSNKTSGSPTPDPADFAAHLEAASQRVVAHTEPSHIDVAVLEKIPGQVLDAKSAALHEARIDVDTATVVVPTLPTAPRSSSAVSRAAREEAPAKGPAPKRRAAKHASTTPKTRPSKARGESNRHGASERTLEASNPVASRQPAKVTRTQPAQSPKSGTSPDAPAADLKKTPGATSQPRQSRRSATRPGTKSGVLELYAPTLPASGPSAPLTPAASLQLAPAAAPSPGPTIPAQGALLG